MTIHACKNILKIVRNLMTIHDCKNILKIVRNLMTIHACKNIQPWSKTLKRCYIQNNKNTKYIPMLSNKLLNKDMSWLRRAAAAKK